MARTISLLYINHNDEPRERIGFRSEQDARTCAHQYVADGYTNVVMRCTSVEGCTVITHWTEAFGAEELQAPEDPTTAFREAITDIVTYTLPQLITELQRMALRGITPSLDWIESAFIWLDQELTAVL